MEEDHEDGSWDNFYQQSISSVRTQDGFSILFWRYHLAMQKEQEIYCDMSWRILLSTISWTEEMAQDLE